jgi:uncharacterized repeat protein (TIGR03847 family)
MPFELHDLNPVDRLTTGAVGQPGDRVFYVQARKGRRLVAVICEKEHVAALCVAIQEFLLALADHDPEAVVEPDPVLDRGMDLELPLNPVFRAGQVNLSYDRDTERLVLIAYELQAEDDEDPPSLVRFWATPAQMRAFAIHGEEVVAAGRPICPMCQQPMEPEGHFCPRRNGHRQ